MESGGQSLVQVDCRQCRHPIPFLRRLPSSFPPPVNAPCLSGFYVGDPQNLTMELTVNDEVKQTGSTGQMVFPVAAVIEFISKMVTLEPGDIISTGTPGRGRQHDRDVPEGGGRDEGDDPGDRDAGDPGRGSEK